MTKNYYYEYKKWSILWGLFLDQQNEVQKVLDNYNHGGWKVVQFEWNSTKEGLFKNIIVFAITVFSLGFISYWTGFSIVFERNEHISMVENKDVIQGETSMKENSFEATASKLFD